MDFQELHRKVLEIGREREKGLANKLDPSDLETLILTTAYFRDDAVGLLKFDLAQAKYKIWDWLGMALTGRYGDIEPNTEDDNVFFGLGIVYTNVNTTEQFIDFLRYNDLDLWRGDFNKEKFTNYVREWTKEEEKLEEKEKKRKGITWQNKTKGKGV